MRRGIVVALAGAVLAAGAYLGSGAVRGASEDDKVKRVEVIRAFAGGGRLGVTLGEVDKDDAARLKLADERGALVRRVEEDSPAAKAGLQKDDVVLRFQGEDVRSASQLARLVRETPAGRTVAIEVSRGGATQKLSATLGDGGRARLRIGNDFEMPLPPEPPEAPEPPVLLDPPVVPDVFHWKDKGGRGFVFRDFDWGERGPRRLGIEFDEVSGQFAQFLKAPGDQAVVVTSVEEGSPAAKAGLKAGDLIVRFAGAEIRKGRDLRDEVRKAEGDEELTVGVQREGRPLDLKVTLAPKARPRRSTGGVSM